MTKKKSNQTEENTKNIAVITNDLGYIKHQLDIIDKKIDQMFRNVPNRSEFEALQDDVQGLENIKEWGLRVIIGALLVAILSLVITGF